METPDTKDCEKEKNLIEHNGNYYVRCETHEEVIRRLQEKHEEALSSRDTYWKERVRKAISKIEESARTQDTSYEYGEGTYEGLVYSISLIRDITNEDNLK